MSVEAADPTACAAPHVRGLQVAGAWWQNNYMVVPGESFGSAQGIPCQNEAVTYSLWVNPATGWQSGSTYGLGVLCRLLRHCNDGYEWWEMNNSESLFIQKDSDGNPKIVFGVGVTVTEATSAAYTLPSTFDGNWHFIAATYAARVLTLYYDGEKVAEQTLTADVNLADNSPLIIGAKCDDFNFYCSDRYAGRLDDVRVYNRALTADEVRDVYAAGATAFDTDVIAWTGAAEGGAAEETANWASASNRRTAGEIYAEGAVLDVSSLADGGVLTHETADAALKVKGVVCTNGQQEVTLHVKAGALELDRPSTQRGLVAHLSFDDPNDRLLDSGTAGLIAASGAWAHNGTADTALPIASVEGVSGNAMEFPASGEWMYWPSTYVKTGAAATTRANGIPAGGETVAYSLWIRPYGLGAWNNGMLGLGDDAIWVFRRGNYGNGFSTYLFLAKGSGGDSSAKLIWSIANWMEDGGTCTYETDDLFDGTWHHVACVYEEKTLTLYYDGRKVAETATAYALAMPDGKPISLGNSTEGGDYNENRRRYLGGFDEFKIFNVALTEEEVAAEYARHSRTLDETSLGTVPSPVAIRLDVGATADVHGYGHAYGSLVGEGSVSVGPATELKLEGAFGLTGTLTGVGSVMAGGLVCPGADGSAFTGTFTLMESAVIEAEGPADAIRPLQLGGRLILPSVAAVDFGPDPDGGRRVLARAAEIVPPDGGFANWRDPKGAEIKVRVKNGEFRCSPETGVVIVIR